MRVLSALVLCVQAYVVLSYCIINPCPAGQTCCPGPIPLIDPGCCPYPNAVCCSDGLHCCPLGTVCNLNRGTCDYNVDQIIPLAFQRREQSEMKLQAEVAKEAQKVEVVSCPGELSFCPDGNTCCLLPDGQYGCCPFPSATCCSDKLHCCPSGTRCDDTSQFCLQTDTLMQVIPKRCHTPAFIVLN